MPNYYRHHLYPPQTYTTKWEKDLQLQSEDINWTQIWQATKSAFPNIVALETNYKVTKASTCHIER